jgi:hypothetical protein
MIAALTTLLVMQVSIDHVVGVVAVRDSFVATADSMVVVSAMTVATIFRRGPGGIGFGYSYPVLVDMAFVNVVHVAIVQIVGVSFVLNCGMAAAGSVLVRVVVVGFAMWSHGEPPALDDFDDCLL